ncbi:uncharacterized protein LOC117191994 isoform X2 [Drosophila miranda]|uniref:uncharacterized protein LOC117191994 isoform X2 n=1 Tax=Drosophila miranda TaxID=7229 RepID=UPI00143F71D1|nr:uncharacterized protein LOC117191994 isoform X2 [Drosophila miranda]
MDRENSQNPYEAQCNQAQCSRSQNSQSARDKVSFGTPQQQQSIYDLVDNAQSVREALSLGIPQQQQSQQQSVYDLFGNNGTIDRSERDLSSMMVGPGNSRKPCSAQCNRALCNCCQQRKSAQYAEASYAFFHNDKTSVGFEPDIKSTTIDRGSSEEACMPHCTDSCSRLSHSLRGLTPPKYDSGYQQSLPPQSSETKQSQYSRIQFSTCPPMSHTSRSQSFQRVNAQRPDRQQIQHESEEFKDIEPFDEPTRNHSLQTFQTPTPSCCRKAMNQSPMTQSQETMTTPQCYSTPYKRNTPAKPERPYCMANAKLTLRFGDPSNSQVNTRTPVGHSTLYHSNAPTNGDSNASLPIRYVDQSSEEECTSLAYAQKLSIDFSQTIHGTSSSDENCMCSRTKTAEEALASRTRAVFFRAMVKENCCNDVIEQTLNGSENFNEYAFQIAFAGLIPEKLGCVDPITMLEAIKLRIDYEWKEIRNNYEKKENLTKTETYARDRSRDRYKDHSKDRSKDRCKDINDGSSSQETQQQVIPNEDIKDHFMPKNQYEVNQGICSYLKAENEYRGLHSDSIADFNVNVNAFESNFFNNNICMNVYSATTDPKP